MKNCVRIDKRQGCEKRSRIADWENDTVIGSGHQGCWSRYGGAQVTLTTLPRQRSEVGGRWLICSRPHKRRCKTITLDNGKGLPDRVSL